MKTGMTHGRPPISGRTRLLGIFADPIDHVRTPAVFNTFFDQHGIDAVFVPLHVPPDHLEAAMRGMRHWQFCRRDADHSA